MRYKPPVTIVIEIDNKPSMLVLTFNGDLSPEMFRKIESIYDYYCPSQQKKIFD